MLREGAQHSGVSREIALRPDEILTEILIPAGAGALPLRTHWMRGLPTRNWISIGTQAVKSSSTPDWVSVPLTETAGSLPFTE